MWDKMVDPYLIDSLDNANDYLLDFTAQLYEKIAELEERIERLEGK